jgi:hypothetical protein
MANEAQPERAYLDRLLQAFEGEIKGETYFADLAPHFDEPGTAGKLALLSRLERCTAETLRPLIERHGLPVRDEATLRPQAAPMVADHGAESWTGYMARMVKDFSPYVNEFCALETKGPAEDRAALARLTRHEECIIEFAQAELAGEPDATAPIREYLEADGG